MLYAIIALLAAIPVVGLISYQRGKARGIDDFLEVLFKSGFDSKVESFKVLNTYAEQGGVVFVGDSITQDYNVYEYFPNIKVYNRGIGGDTSEGVLKRLEESVLSLYPKKVFLQIGTNDFELLDSNVESVFKHIKEIVETIKNSLKNTEVYVISIFPVNPLIDKATVGKRNNNEIKRTNERLSQMKSCSFLNVYDKLIADDYLNPLYTIEGLHLNQKGYEVVTQVLKPWLKD